MSLPVGLPQIAVAWVGLAAFVVLMLVARRARVGGGSESGAVRSRASIIGIVLQGIAIGLVCVGPPRLSLDPLSAPAIGAAAAVALLMVAADALFFWASRAMGRNWSIVARTRADHALVTAGPFAHLRHPIYTALFLMLVAFAIAFGREAWLLPAIPLYALGTWLRVRIEERMLRTMFGPTYDAYAGRVKRFVPGVI